jgi:hypothetical protein
MLVQRGVDMDLHLQHAFKRLPEPREQRRDVVVGDRQLGRQRAGYLDAEAIPGELTGDVNAIADAKRANVAELAFNGQPVRRTVAWKLQAPRPLDMSCDERIEDLGEASWVLFRHEICRLIEHHGVRLGDQVGGACVHEPDAIADAADE